MKITLQQPDWTIIAHVKPHRNPPRGFATFTVAESECIRQFYRQSGLSARIIAEHFNVNIHTIYRCINRDHKGVRRSLPTAAGRRRYLREKARRTPWIKEAEA